MTKLEIAQNFIDEFIKSNPLIIISGDVLNSALDKLINAIPDETVLAGGFVDTLKIADTEPTDGWEKGVYILGDVGTYSQGFTTIEGKFNIATFNGTTWSKVEVEMPTVQVDQVFNPDSTDPASQKATGDWIQDKIGDIEQIDVSYETLDLKSSTWHEGEYMGPSGVLINNVDTKYLKITLKKGEAIDYRGGVIQGANNYVFLGDNGIVVVGEIAAAINVIASFQFIAQEDGDFYINQNIINGSVEVLNHHKIIQHDSTIVDYVNNKISKYVEGVPQLVEVNYIWDNWVKLLTSQIEGVSNYNDNNIINTEYKLSEFIPVNKGDVIYYSGNIGNHGVGLYSNEKKLIAKLAISPNIQQVVVDMKIPINETGFLVISEKKENPSTLKIARQVLQQVDFNNIGEGQVLPTKERYLSLNKPNSLWRINLIGGLPSSNEVSQNMDVEFSENGRVFLKTKGKFAWQGQSSVANPKKNYTFDVLNDDGDSLKLKIGDSIATDSFHLKGFQKDVSLIRDNLTSKMWYKIRKSGTFPDNRIANLPLDTSSSASDISYFQEDAKFFADGFPVEIYNNNVFLGVYIFRLKKSRENYKLNNTNKQNIFLEYDYTIASGPYVLLKWQAFDPIQFELKSPKITGYTPGAIINDSTVMNSINGLWDWTSAIYNNSGYVAHENKVVLNAWIDYLIAVELSNHWDGLNQNILLMTHDGVRWSPYIYDGDHTWGIEITLKRDTKQAFVLDYDARGDGENKTFWKNFRTIYLTQIKARYTELRKNGIISIQNIEKNALEFSRPIGYEHYKKEFTKWGYGLNPNTHGKLHLHHILTFANSSINYMDSQWLLP